MKLKKILTVTVIAMMMFSSISSLNVSAKNNKDTVFDFNVQPNSTVYTNGHFRAKEDSSAPYCHLQIAASNGFNMRILSIDNNLNPYSIVDATKGTALMYAGQKRLIRCSVRDVGRRYCAIGAKSRNNGDSSGRAMGVWSPDSLGSYPYAN